mgnify:CR=1 FL=1
MIARRGVKNHNRLRQDAGQKIAHENANPQSARQKLHSDFYMTE